MLFPAKRGCHAGSLKEMGGVESCVLILCPEAFSPTTKLPDHASKLRKLQDDDLLILTLARGHYCPLGLANCGKGISAAHPVEPKRRSGRVLGKALFRFRSFGRDNSL